MTEDWSLVRSPSRARRRLAQGHRQNIREVAEPMSEYREWVEHIDRRIRQMLLRENVEALKTLSVGLER